MKIFKLNCEYRYSAIQNEICYDSMEIFEYGVVLIGEYFLVVRDIRTNIVCSFVLTGMTNKETIYKCIYNDFK